ncbi:hypothetical protein SESBI_34407 [Sesbania bispinosa]|nr:hypothetical protein SESBI_34407 [Sesbania bispinosa]
MRYRAVRYTVLQAMSPSSYEVIKRSSFVLWCVMYQAVRYTVLQAMRNVILAVESLSTVTSVSIIHSYSSLQKTFQFFLLPLPENLFKVERKWISHCGVLRVTMRIAISIFWVKKGVVLRLPLKNPTRQGKVLIRRSLRGGETMVNMVETVEEVAIVPVAKKRRLRPEEIRTRGSGDLAGYFLRINYESKKEDESEEGKPEFFKDESGKLKFPLYWSPCPVGILGIDSTTLTKEETVEVKFLKGLPPLRCIKLIRFGDDPVKLKTFMDQMAPKLDKKALMLEMKRQRLAAANKEKVGASSSVAASELPNIEPSKLLLLPARADVRSIWDHRFDVGSVIDEHLTLKSDVKRLEKKGDQSAHVMLQVYGAQIAFLGRYLESKSKSEKSSQSDLGDKVASLEAKLLGYEEMKTRVAGLEGRVALLGQENTKLKEDKTTAEKSLLDMISERDSLKTDLEKAKLTIKSVEEKYTLDFKQLNSDAAKSYGLGFERALAQAKHFNPNIDVSGCDPLKEIMKGVLVDLGEGDEEDGSGTPENREEIGDSQGGDFEKPTDDIDGVGNEDQGNAPA